MSDVDGRLDLDDLGRVLDGGHDGSRAVSLDPPEVIGQDAGTTWGERLQAAGITPWVRRHAVVLASVTAVVVLGATAGTWYVRSRPPALDPDLHVITAEITPSNITDNGNTQTFDGPTVADIGGVGDLLWSAYGVAPTDPSDTSAYRIVALVGPGIRASTPSHGHAPTTSGVPNPTDLATLIDCSDPSAFTGRVGDYRLVVSRTDSLGRTVTAPVQLPDGTDDWSQQVRGRCFGRAAVDGYVVTAATVGEPRPGRPLALRMNVTSHLPVTTVLTAGTSFTGDVTAPIAWTIAPTVLTSGGSAVVTAELDVRDCSGPEVPRVQGVTADRSVYTDAPGLYAESRIQDSPDQDVATGSLRLTADETRRLRAALGRSCSGGGTVTAKVVGVGPRPATAVPVYPQTGSARLTLDVRAPLATSLVASAPVTSPGLETGWTFSTVHSAVRGGRATITVDYAADCSTGYLQAPLLRIEVQTVHGRYPFEVPVDDAAFTRAVERGCSGSGIGFDPGWTGAPTG